MANTDVDQHLVIRDSLIDVNEKLAFANLMESMMQTNANLIKAEQNKTLARLDLKAVIHATTHT